MRAITRCAPIAIALMLAVAGHGTSALAAIKANGLPGFFVYLRDVDPTIVQDMRYFGVHNFVGRRVDGYLAGECILTRQAANALKRFQKELKRKGLSLKVYDCYRPTRGVRHFIRWAKDIRDRKTKGEFYPTIDKRILFRSGYISTRSAHSRGSTVDLAITPLPVRPEPKFRLGDRQIACHRPKSERWADNSLDFGTGYDCFHSLSHTRNPRIKGRARANRNLLVDGMRRQGFRNYSKEWWHFTLNGEPYRKTFFDFPIKPRPGAVETPTVAALSDGGRSEIPVPIAKPGLDADYDSNAIEQALKATRALPAAIREGLKPVNPSRLFLFVCPASDEHSALRLEPSREAGIVEFMPPDDKAVLGYQCGYAKHSLEEWHRLRLEDQRNFPPPFCLINEPALEPATGSEYFWIEGSAIYEKNRPRPACRRKP